MKKKQTKMLVARVAHVAKGLGLEPWFKNLVKDQNWATHAIEDMVTTLEVFESFAITDEHLASIVLAIEAAEASMWDTFVGYSQDTAN